MVLAVRAVLDLVDVDLAEGLWTVLKVAATRACQEMSFLGQCATVLSYVEFLH